MNDSEQILAGLGHIMPIKLGQAKISKRGVGLVIVDEVNGFATVGAGYLAPPVENPQVSAMIDDRGKDREITRLNDAGPESVTNPG